jgi:Domain of unknown function (DUF1707)
MTEPGDETASAGAGGNGRDSFRASHADRERVIEALKAAFVQGQLAKVELDTRAGQAFASRTYADLAALTADIPPAPATARPARQPVPARPQVPVRQPAPIRSWPLARAALKAGSCLIISAVCLRLAFIADPGPGRPAPHQSWALPAFVLFQIALLAVPVILGYGVVMSWKLRRSRRQLPPPV